MCVSFSYLHRNRDYEFFLFIDRQRRMPARLLRPTRRSPHLQVSPWLSVVVGREELSRWAIDFVTVILLRELTIWQRSESSLNLVYLPHMTARAGPFLSDSYEHSACLRDQGRCHLLCIDYRSGEIRCECRTGFLLNEIDRHSCQGGERCGRRATNSPCRSTTVPFLVHPHSLSCSSILGLHDHKLCSTITKYLKVLYRYRYSHIFFFFVS